MDASAKTFNPPATSFVKSSRENLILSKDNEALKEIYRVLKPGGYLVIGQDTDSLLFRTVWWLWTKWKGSVWAGSHINCSEPKEIILLLQKNDFLIKRIKYLNLNMEIFIKDAVEKGAKITAGGKRKNLKGYYFDPTVLANVNEPVNAACHEVFGPVAPIIVAKNDEEAVKIANSLEYGLSGSLWTKDLKKGEMLARKIDTGSVFINSISTSHPLLPIGGIKKSGFGRELSHYGIKEFVNIKAISIY